MSESHIAKRLRIYLDNHSETIRRRDITIGCQESFRVYWRTYWKILQQSGRPGHSGGDWWVMGTKWSDHGCERHEWACGTASDIARAFLVALRNHRYGRAPDLRFLLLAPSAITAWNGSASLHVDAWEDFADQGVTKDDQRSFLDEPTPAR